MSEVKSQPIMPPQPPYYPPRRKSSWWIPLVIILAVIIIFFVIIAAIIGSIGESFTQKEFELKDKSILKLELSGVQEYVKQNPFAFLSDSKSYNFYDIITAVKRAKTDKSIKGIYIDASVVGLGWAQAIELQEALVDFRTSKKFIYTYITAGDEFTYFNSLPSTKIIMPREGMLEMNGFGIAGMFFKGMFDKIGLDYTIIGYEDFKSAAESLGKTQFSDSSRYQLQVLLNQRNDYFINSIAYYRNKEKTEVLDFMTKAHFMADSVQAHGYVDEFMSKRQFKEMLKDEVYGKAKESKTKKNGKDKEDKDGIDEDDRKLEFVSVGDYLSSGSNKPKDTDVVEGKKIAIIYGVGPIIDDMGKGFNFNSDDYNITPDEFIKYLTEAKEDKEVKAILIRINSPGGSVIASDAIWEAIHDVRKVKPVYASMGDVAASGGYYIPMACDTIIAHPATITGSIGVIAAIPNFSKTIDKLGITMDTISTSKDAFFVNPMLSMKPGDKEKLDLFGKNTYFRFLDKVAKARNKTFEETRSLAKGRVWSGQDAFDRGLIDVLGGYGDAIELVKKRIGIPKGKKVAIDVYPKDEDEFEVLLKAFGLKNNDAMSPQGLKSLATLFGADQSQALIIFKSLPKSMQEQIKYNLQLLSIGQNEKIMMAMPTMITFE